MSRAQRIEFVAETTSSLSMRTIAAWYASGVEWASPLTATDATTLASSGRAWGSARSTPTMRSPERRDGNKGRRERDRAEA